MIVTVGSPVTVYNQSARAALSGVRDAYFDGLIGVCGQSGSDFTSFGPDGEGPSTIKAVGPIGDFAASATTISTASGQPAGTSYCSGGPVLDLGGTNRAMVIHFERWPSANPLLFWASLGVAKSTDSGASWVVLGENLTPSYAYNSGASSNYQDCEGGPLVPLGLYYYQYFREYTGPVSFSDSYLSVARCLITDYHAAVLANTAPTMDKWQGGTTWGGSNIGAQLSIDNNLHWGDAWWDDDLGAVLYLGNYNLPNQANAQCQLSISGNGLSFEPPVTISSETHATSAATYNSLCPGTLTGNRRGRGPWTAIYEYGVRWTDTEIRTRTIDLSLEVDRRARMRGGGRALARA